MASNVWADYRADGNRVYRSSNTTTTSLGSLASFDKLARGMAVSEEPSKSKISARLYFSYLKKNFNKTERKKMDRRMENLNEQAKKLEEMALEAEKRGQEALSEKLLDSAIKELRESELYAKGYNKYLTQDVIDEYKFCTNEVILKTELKNYARVIPKNAAKKIKKAIKAQLFDRIYIIHCEGEEAEELTKEEVEADPIAVGTIDDVDRHYFIVDWEDEYCHLTMDEIIKNVNLNKTDMTLTATPELIKATPGSLIPIEEDDLS